MLNDGPRPIMSIAKRSSHQIIKSVNRNHVVVT
jgi:hypothetical protein